MLGDDASFDVDYSKERFAKRVRNAALLRDVPPERSLEMAFQLIRSARKLGEAADRARA